MKRIVVTACVGILLASGLTIGSSVMSAGEAKNLNPGEVTFSQGEARQSEARDLTIRLARLNARYQLGDKAERASVMKDISTVAAMRREMLAALIESDPAEVLRVALPEGFGANLPAQVRENVEQHVDLEGRLEILYVCGESESHLSHYLKVAGKRLSLHFAGPVPADLLTDSVVRIRGVQVGEAIALDLNGGPSPLSSATSLPTTSASVAPNTFGEQKVLVLVVNFQDNQTQPWTPDQVRSVVFGSVNDFYKESSYQQTWLGGDVFGWYTLPISSGTCDTSMIATYAKQAAVAAGVDVSAYNRLVYAYPALSTCGFSGASTVGGSPSQSWINGSMSLRTVGHELGHGFGLYHARAMDCGTEVIGSSCSTVEYGDILDMLGAPGMTGHSHAAQKERLGWLNYGASPPLTTVQTSGTYFLDPYETVGSNSKALKILRSTDPATGISTWYYVEFRQPIGFDSFISGNSNVTTGVLVHTSVDPYGRDNYLLDMTPATSSFSDAALTVGRSYTDPTTNITIMPVSVSNNEASVSVSFGAPTCAQADPSMTINPSVSQWVSAGSTVSYQVTLTNNDSGCGSSDFNFHANVPVDWSAAFASPTVSLAPGTSVTVNLSVTSPSSASDGFYDIGITAVNSANSNYSASGSVACSIMSGLAVSVASDQPTYTRNQVASVTAIVTAGGSPVCGASVTFTMTKSNGSKVTGTATTGTDGSAIFKYRFNKQKDPVGIYEVAASANLNGMIGSGSTSFGVSQ